MMTTHRLPAWMVMTITTLLLMSFSTCHLINETPLAITGEALIDPWLDSTPTGGELGKELEAVSNDAPLIAETTTISRRASRRRQHNLTLRILPLGASITAGVHSIPMDGYRKHLRNWLRQAKFPVTMVGSQFNPSGSLKNGAHEGFPGLRISQVHDKLSQDGWLDHKPNVVLIHLGTNNCVQNVEVEQGAEELRELILDIIDHVSGVHVVISTLGPLHDPNYQRRCQGTLNPGIRAMFHDLHKLNYSISLVDFGDPNGYITPLDINNDDGIHPTQAGYTKYATLWYYAILEAYHAGHVVSPEKTSFPDKGGASGADGDQPGVDDADTFTEAAVPTDPKKDYGET